MRRSLPHGLAGRSLKGMATCYRCGRPIPSTDFKLRRRVQTGERVSRRYPNPSISARHLTYGIRLVCVPCARALDWAERRRELVQYLELAAAIVLILAALVASHLS